LLLLRGEETHSYTEITTCGDKSVASVKTGAVHYTNVTNPSENRMLILMDDSVSPKRCFVMPIIHPDSIPGGAYGKINDTDFHFTGNRKTIAGYECEEFTLEIPELGKATGYLVRGITGGNASGIVRTNLGIVMECLLAIGTDKRETAYFVVTKLETDLVIGDAYFSTELPAGYSSLMEGLKIPDMPHE
jgi:hypothetical protein